MRGVLALALALALPASDQAPPRLSKSLEVSVTNVDAVVTDSKGQPITDLTAADFEVRQDGVVQPLTNFSFIRHLPPAPPPVPGEGVPAPVPAPAPTPVFEPTTPRAARAHLIVFIDALHLTASSKNRALRSLREYLPTVVGPDVEVQLVTWERALRIRGPFTSDVSILSSLLDSLEGEVALGEVSVMERTRMVNQIDAALAADARTAQIELDNTMSALRAWCDQQTDDIDSTILALRASFSAVAGVEGRKILFLVTERLTPYPGRDLWDYILYGRRRAGLAGGPSQARGAASPDLSGLTYLHWDRQEALGSLTRAANAAGISLVTIDAAGLATDEMVSAERGASVGRMDEAIGPADMFLALGFLADETGGRAIVGRNDLAAALKDTEADWTAYYSLGYESPSTKPGAPRRITVAVKRPGAHVRSRKSVVERTPEEKVTDAVLSGAYIPHTMNPLRASLQIGTPKKSGKLFLVPLEFKVPFDKLTLVPEGGRARGALLFTAVSATPDGRVSPVMTERAPVEVPEGDLAKLAGKAFTYSATHKVRPGPQVFSIALTDEISRLSSYVQPDVVVGSKPATR